MKPASACVFCGGNVGNRPAYAEAARELGRLFAREGITLVYGGGGIGLMNETARAAKAAGGKVVGIITAALMAREAGKRDIDELIVVDTMHQRKALMASRSQAFVVLPGGFGTFDEACEMLTWNQLAIVTAPVVLVNVEGYYDAFLAQLERCVADGLLRDAHRTMLTVVERVDGLLAALEAWRPPPPWVPQGTPVPLP